jgi:CRP-like cAMP-binding protein
MSAISDPSSLFVFRDVSSRSIAELNILAPLTQFKMGMTIFKQGAKADVALLLVSGKLGVEVESEGAKRAVGQVHPGEIVGEQALFSRGAVRSATVRAETDSQALIIDWDLLEKAARNEAVVAIERHLLGTLARRIRATNTAIQRLWKETEVPSDPIEKRGFGQRLRALFGTGRL